MSPVLREAVGEFFVRTQKQLMIMGAYATREVVLDEAEYSSYRYYDFIEYYRDQFARHNREAILLGRAHQFTPTIRFQPGKIGTTPLTRVALLPRRQEQFNTLVEEMNTQALDADPYLAPYQDIRPMSGNHYLTIDVRGGILVQSTERALLEKSFALNVLSLSHENLYTVRPDTIEHKVEVRRVVPHPPHEDTPGRLIDMNFDNDVA
jgi:hypothetical protein